MVCVRLKSIEFFVIGFPNGLESTINKKHLSTDYKLVKCKNRQPFQSIQPPLQSGRHEGQSIL